MLGDCAAGPAGAAGGASPVVLPSELKSSSLESSSSLRTRRWPWTMSDLPGVPNLLLDPPLPPGDEASCCCCCFAALLLSAEGVPCFTAGMLPSIRLGGSTPKRMRTISSAVSYTSTIGECARLAPRGRGLMLQSRAARDKARPRRPDFVKRELAVASSLSRFMQICCLQESTCALAD